MVVDGKFEFVGSDAGQAKAAIDQSARAEKATIRVLPIAGDSGKISKIRVEVDPLPVALQALNAEVYFAIAANEASSQVLRGENSGRWLHHVAVVRSVWSVGKIDQGASFVKEIPMAPQNQVGMSQLRFVAFVQERGQGRVLGATMRRVTP